MMNSDQDPRQWYSDEDTLDTEHGLRCVQLFGGEQVGDDGYVRWYCWCGAVGGRKPGVNEARADHGRHQREMTTSGV